MTPCDVITLVGDAYHKSRFYWQVEGSSNEDARSIVGALVKAGLCVQSPELDATVLKVVENLCSNYEGRFTDEDVGVEVGIALGLVDVGVER